MNREYQPPPPPDDDLDQVIREALHIDVDPDRLSRLQRYWQFETRRRVRRRQVRTTLCVAAAVLVAATIFTFRGGRPDPPRSAANDPPKQDKDDLPEAERSSFPGRLPTSYERFMFAARTPTQPSQPPATSAVEWIARVVRRPPTDAISLLEACGIARHDAELFLLNKLSRATAREQAVIVQLLAVCGSPLSVPNLLRLSRQEWAGDAVPATIETIVGSDGLPRVIRATADPLLRIDLMRRLLAVNTPAAVRDYLALVADDVFRADALTAIDERCRPPVTTLLSFLDHQQPEIRLSAAVVLGHINGPEVTHALITSINNEPAKSQEAWLALLACRGPLASEFVNYAAHRPQLLGHLNSARLRRTRLIP